MNLQWNFLLFGQQSLAKPACRHTFIICLSHANTQIVPPANEPYCKTNLSSFGLACPRVAYGLYDGWLIGQHLYTIPFFVGFMAPFQFISVNLKYIYFCLSVYLSFITLQPLSNQSLKEVNSVEFQFILILLCIFKFKFKLQFCIQFATSIRIQELNWNIKGILHSTDDTWHCCLSGLLMARIRAFLSFFLSFWFSVLSWLCCRRPVQTLTVFWFMLSLSLSLSTGNRTPWGEIQTSDLQGPPYSRRHSDWTSQHTFRCLWSWFKRSLRLKG